MNAALSQTDGVYNRLADGKAAHFRAKADAEDLSRTIESMRKNSATIMAQGMAAGAAVAAACMAALKAIWATILNILRFLARLFGAKLKSDESNGIARTELSAASKDAATALESAPEMSPDEAADVAQELLQAGQTMSLADADGFMRALEFAGVCGADRALLDLARQPQFINRSGALDALLSNCLEGVITALDGLDTHIINAVQERASAAQTFANAHKSPILTEDLVQLQRHALAKGFLSSEEALAADRLLKADDAMLAISAHRQVIVETAMLIAGQVSAAGVLLAPHAATLQRIGGANWAARVSSASEALDGQPELIVGVEDLTSIPPDLRDVKDSVMKSVEAVDAEIDFNSESAEIARQSAQQTVAKFLLGISSPSSLTPQTSSALPPAVVPGPIAPLTASQRLRIAAQEAAKFNPPTDDDQLDGLNEHEKP